MSSGLKGHVVKQQPLQRSGETDHRVLPFGERITPGLIQQICEDIIRLVDPEQIILFGSRAHGKVHEESDLDLFVDFTVEDAQKAVEVTGRGARFCKVGRDSPVQPETPGFEPGRFTFSLSTSRLLTGCGFQKSV